MASSIPIPPRPETRLSENVWSGATPALFFATSKWRKVGRSRPLQCITRVQTARHAVCNLYVPNICLAPGYFNGDGMVTCVFHAPSPFAQERPQTFPALKHKKRFTRPREIARELPYLLRGLERGNPHGESL